MWLFWLGCRIMDYKVSRLGKTLRTPPCRASKGERMVEGILRKHGFEYMMQYPMRYIHIDFAVWHKERLIFIEYDGPQHYHPVARYGGVSHYLFQRVRDIAQDLECRDRDIPLLRIKYNVAPQKMERMILDFIEANT